MTMSWCREPCSPGQPGPSLETGGERRTEPSLVPAPWSQPSSLLNTWSESGGASEWHKPANILTHTARVSQVRAGWTQHHAELHENFIQPGTKRESDFIILAVRFTCFLHVTGILKSINII